MNTARIDAEARLPARAAAGFPARRIGAATAGALLAVTLASNAAHPPAAPDYDQPAAWAARPDMPSRVDELPAGVAKGNGTGVPVFFIHPTTYFAPTLANAAFDAGGEARARVDDVVLRFQASVFNDCCRVWAPRYRQASLKAVTSHTPEAYATVDLAYSDVSRAFDAFLVANPATAFVVASHSQGSIHALRLILQRIVGTPFQRRLVAAYAIGVALPKQVVDAGLPVCVSDRSTGCVVSWNSVRRGHVDERRQQEALIWWDGRYQPVAGRPLVCVNPLTWIPDGSAEPSANLGAIYSAGRREAIPSPVPALTGAWCERGLLGVSIPPGQRRHFGDVLTLGGVYHDFDYGLFYMNIRVNVDARIRAATGTRG